MIDPMLPVPHRVRASRRESHDTVTLELTREAPGESPRFVPGQFNMLYAFGVGEAAISISSEPGRLPIFTHTTRVVGGTTRALVRLRSGGMIGVRGPFGNGWPIERAAGRDVVLVAGGIGLAPLRGLLDALVAERERYGRIALAYGARTPDDVLFRTELERWRSRHRIEIAVTVDRAGEGWPGKVGFVTALLGRLDFEPAEAVAMICGPEVMMRYAAQVLIGRGVEPGSIHLAMERNMKCAIGFCGHCQFGPAFVCRDGPIFPYERIGRMLGVAEL